MTLERAEEDADRSTSSSPSSYTTVHEDQKPIYPHASLPGLPPELHLHIFSHLLSSSSHRPTRTQPAFLNLNRSIRLACLDTWYATNTFYFAKPRPRPHPSLQDQSQSRLSHRQLRTAFITSYVTLIGRSHASKITKVTFIVRKDVFHHHSAADADVYDDFGERNSSVGLTLTLTKTNVYHSHRTFTSTSTSTHNDDDGGGRGGRGGSSKQSQWKAEWDRNNIDTYDVDLMEKQLEWMEEEREEEEHCDGKGEEEEEEKEKMKQTDLELLAARVPSLVQAHINPWQARQKMDWSQGASRK